MGTQIWPRLANGVGGFKSPKVQNLVKIAVGATVYYIPIKVDFARKDIPRVHPFTPDLVMMGEEGGYRSPQN